MDQQSSINVFTQMIEMKMRNKEDYVQLKNEILPPRQVQIQPRLFISIDLKDGILILDSLHLSKFSLDGVQSSQEYKDTHIDLKVNEINEN